MNIKCEKNIVREVSFIVSSYNIIGPRREKTCFLGVAKNTGTDQPVHPCSLISAFVFRYLESIICIITTGKIVSVAEETDI